MINQITLIVISIIGSAGLAYITALLTRKNEIEKIKEDNRNIKHKIDYEIKQMFITIESGNYRVLYEKKLAALKRIKEIQFTILENDSEQYNSIVMYMNDFPFDELIKSIHDLIIDYSYIFNEEIVHNLKNIYYDANSTNNNYDPESSKWLSYPERTTINFQNLIISIKEDLNLDLESVKNKITKPSP